MPPAMVSRSIVKYLLNMCRPRRFADDAFCGCQNLRSSANLGALNWRDSRRAVVAAQTDRAAFPPLVQALWSSVIHAQDLPFAPINDRSPNEIV
jgi:hypothetical protein